MPDSPPNLANTLQVGWSDILLPVTGEPERLWPADTTDLRSFPSQEKDTICLFYHILQKDVFPYGFFI